MIRWTIFNAIRIFLDLDRITMMSMRWPGKLSNVIKTLHWRDSIIFLCDIYCDNIVNSVGRKNCVIKI